MAMAPICIAAQSPRASPALTASVSASFPLIPIYNKTTNSASSPGPDSLVILSEVEGSLTILLSSSSCSCSTPDPPRREAERLTRTITNNRYRGVRVVRSLPLAPSSVPLIPSPQCAAFIEKSELTTGGSLPQCRIDLSPKILHQSPFISRPPSYFSALQDFSFSAFGLSPGLPIRSPLDCDEPAASR